MRFLFADLWKRLNSAQAKRGKDIPSGFSFEGTGEFVFMSYFQRIAPLASCLA